VNLFEGARRIALVISAIAVIGTVAGAFINKPYVVAKYRVADFNAPAVKSEECRISTDKVQYETLQTPSGITYNLNLCFAGQFWEKEKEYFIPYKQTPDGVWGTSKYSTEAQEYVDNYVQYIFKLSPTDFAEIEEEYSSKKWFEVGHAIGYLLGGLAIFWTLVWTIGWIVRGFMGIPRGQDRRAATNPSTATTVATN
jgi:hypothetical protein